MKLQYLGTGGAEGFPGIFCSCPTCNRARAAGGHNLKSRSCAIINDNILIDVSPDLYMQSLRLGVELWRVNDVVITHTHGDHFDTFSLCLRARDGASILPEKLDGENQVSIYGNERAKILLKNAIEDQPHANPSRLRFTPIMQGTAFEVGNITFYPLEANHKDSDICYIYVITDGKSWILYANDTGMLSDETLKEIKNIGAVFNVVSMDCARGTLLGDSHMGIAENIKLRSYLKKIGCANENTKYYLTHLSHMGGLTHDEFQKNVLEYGFKVAYDGLCIEV